MSTKRITLPSPIDDAVTLRVTFKVEQPTKYNDDEFEEDESFGFEHDDETNVFLHVRKIEQRKDGEFVDVSTEWINSEFLEELEEELKTAYDARILEKYADRFGR